MLSANQINPDAPASEINVGELVAVISEVTGVPSSRIMSRCKLQEACTARNIAYTFLYDKKLAAQTIGKHFGRTHGAVLSGVRRLKLDMEQDFRVFEKFTQVQKRVQNPEEANILFLIAERFSGELTESQRQVMEARRQLFEIQQEVQRLTQKKQTLERDIETLEVSLSVTVS